MKYQAYPEYKVSGVEWLGEVPAYWRFVRFKFVANVQKGKLPKKIVADEDGKFPPYLTMDYLRTGYPENFVDDKSLIPINDGEVLLLWDGANAGEFIESRYGVISSTVAHIKFISQFNHRFCWYLVKSLEIELRTTTIGMGIPHVSGEKLNNLIFYEPLFLEQQQIANFLDHETAKIDTLIEKQQQLIKLLKEKRQAVISHAVTKGLNPNAPMRDSGVEWLGEVPKHWNSMQIRRIISRMEQGKSPECDNKVAEFDEWGVLKTSCVNKGIYNSEANKALPDNIKPFPQYEVKEGDILMSRASGSINLIGSVAYVYKTRPKILLSDKIFRLYLDSSMSKIFFCYLMYSTYMRANIERAISGAEGMANNITKGAVIGFVFALPPLDEQQFIVDFIFKRLDKFRRLIQKAEVAINLMQERRTALISAAVTGKIDVRNWQAPEPLPSNNEISKEEAA